MPYNIWITIEEVDEDGDAIGDDVDMGKIYQTDDSQDAEDFTNMLLKRHNSPYRVCVPGAGEEAA